MIFTQCDLCKAFYPPDTLLSAHILLTRRLPADMQYRGNPKVFDFCPKCVDAFYAFVAHKDKDEE